METEFRKDTLLTVSYRQILNYLGMMLDFSEPGKVLVQMSDYVKNMLHDTLEDMDGKAATPAAAHLFKVNENDLKVLPDDKKEISIHLVM